MFNHRLLPFVGLALASMSVCSRAQENRLPLDRPIDVQELRSQVLGNLLETPAASLPHDNGFLWGIELGRIPELLYLHCPALSDRRGLLIARVHPGSTADLAGLKSGQILLQAGNQVLYSPDDLPVLANGVKTFLLDRGEVIEVALAGGSTPADGSTGLLRDDAVSAATFAPLSRSNAIFGEAAAKNLVPRQAVAVACVNGQYQIEAMVQVGERLEKVCLAGSREEIERQMSDMPESLQSAVRSQLQ